MTLVPESSADGGGAGGGGEQLAYAELTSTVTVVGTAAATPTDVVSSGAVTYAASLVRIEVFIPAVVIASNGDDCFVSLWDGATALGNLAWVAAPTGTLDMVTSVLAARYLTPTAAEHTYRVTAYKTGGTVQVRGAAGGSGVLLPGFIRVSTA